MTTTTTTSPNVPTSVTEKHVIKDDDTSSNLKKEGIDLEQVSELSQEPIPPPDGGLKAWLTVFGAFCCFFATQGYGYSWGVYLRQYNTVEYPGNMTLISWVGSLWYWFCTITGPISMWLASKFNDRLIVGVACILCCLALMFASITNEIWQLYLTQGVMSGIGTSLAWYVCLRNPQQWFDKRRGLAVGLTMSASGVGGLALSNISNACFEAVGYRWALRILGFIELVALAIGAAFSFRLNPIPKNVPFIDLKDFKNKDFIIFFVIHFVGNFAFYMPASFVPSYADYLKIDPWVGTNISAIMAALMFVGKISVGFISDYVGRFNMAVFCSIMACIVHLAVWLTATSAGSMWAFACLYGIFGGGYIAMITSLTAQIVGVDRVDTGTGWAFFAWSWGGLAAQPACSAIIEMGSGNNYQGAIIYSGVLFFAGACLCWLLRVRRGGWKILKAV